MEKLAFVMGEKAKGCNVDFTVDILEINSFGATSFWRHLSTIKYT